MSRETGPQDYQFRHAQRIINGYSGIASGIMELHDPTADGFMRVADMRRDIVITQKSPSKTYDYDQVGPVRVAKILEIPRIGRGEDGVSHTRGEGDVWILEIDDQRLWKELNQDGTLEQREQRFVEQFRDEVVIGTTKFLLEEKLFNGGIYSPAVVMGGLSLMSYAIPVLAEAVTIASGTHTLNVDISSIISVACNHFLFNTMAWGLTQRHFFRVGVINHMLPDRFHLGPNSTEPFIRNNPPEILMPVVPLDRLVRGGVYLKSHGSELIQTP